MAMVLGFVLLVSTSIGRDLLEHEGPLVLGVFFIPFRTSMRVNLLTSYIGLMAIYSICFVVAFRAHGGFLQNLRSLSRGSGLPRIPNWLVAMPFASSALLLIVIAITILQDQLGVPTGSLPPQDPYVMLYLLAYSPVLEEWTFRISTIGFAVGLRILVSRGTLVHFPLSFLSPERAKAQAGLPRIADSGWRGLHWSEWLALAVTSIGFGLAHIFAGGGWQTGKVVTAGLSGLTLGICFLAYGGYASILLHWFFNFYFEVFLLGGTLLGGVFDTLGLSVSLLTIAVGILGLVVAVSWILFREERGGRAPMPYKLGETQSSLV